VPVDDFAAQAAAFFAGDGKGLNITVPFKLDARAFADVLTPRAERAGAVNTLAKQADGSIQGDTTDGVGMVRDIVDNLGWQIAGKRVLILGAGGAVRGVMEPVLAEGPAQLVVANRTVEKAEQLAELFTELSSEGGTVSGCGFADLAGQRFDLVINGTAASLQGDLPPLPDQLLAAGACCYDMMYAAQATVFNQWATGQGAVAVADGLGMLVEQAAESFAIWRGVRPDTTEVIAQVRQSLS